MLIKFSLSILIIQQIMSSRFMREPIHLSIFNRGKLRRVEHQKKQLSSTVKDLTLSTNDKAGKSKTERKHQKHHYLKKVEDRIVYVLATSDNQSTSEVERHDFRAIHTANPYQVDQGQSARTVTSKTGFQNSFRSNIFLYKRKANTSHSKYSKVQVKYPKIDNPEITEKTYKSKLYEEFSKSLHRQRKQAQQFYQYKHKDQNSLTKSNDRQNFHPISGVRIQPFERRNIREVYQGEYRQKIIQRYNFILNQ